MGAVELKFSGLFEKSNYLKEFCCPYCDKFITDNDISENNYKLWVSDYANEINKEQCLNSSYYGLSFWLKSVEHQDCPATETCQNCCMRFLTATMKEINSDYYCLDCVKEVSHE